MSGLLVQKDYQYTLVDPSDLHTYTKLQTSYVTQSLSVPYEESWDVLTFQIGQMFEEIKQTTFDDNVALHIHDTIYVIHTSTTSVTLDWVSNPVNDMISDSIVAIILQINQNPINFQVEKPKPQNDSDLQKLSLIERHLVAHFGWVTVDQSNKTISLNFDGTPATYTLSSQTVECADEQFREQIEDILKYVHGAVFPIKGRKEEPKNTMIT